MVNAVSSIINIILGGMTGEANNRFWAVVLQADETSALLEFRGEQAEARLETAVRAGEKLLLEKEGILDGKLHCKVLQRIPSAETANRTQDGCYAFWNPLDRHNAPYLLVVSEDENREQGQPENKRWRFTLHTAALGTVTLLAALSGERCEINILVENQKAAKELAHLRQDFTDDDRYSPVIRSIRVMHRDEQIKTGVKGSHIDRLR